MRAVLGVDAGSRTAAEVEHQLLDLAARLGAGPGAVLCTHAVRQGTPHYAGTITLPDPPSDPLTLPAAGASGGDLPAPVGLRRSMLCGVR